MSRDLSLYQTSGVRLLETYLAPGLVSAPEGSRETSYVRPEFSSELLKRPDLLKRLKGEIRALIAFLNGLTDDDLFIVRCLKSGRLRLVRDVCGLLWLKPDRAFQESVPAYKELLMTFSDHVASFGGPDERIRIFPVSREGDTHLTMEQTETERKYDEINEEFHFTYLEPVHANADKSRIVRENVELALQKTRELLDQMRSEEGSGKERFSDEG